MTNNTLSVDDGITIDLSGIDSSTINYPSSSIYTVSGPASGSLSWSSMNDTITLGNYSQNELHVQGNARVTGDLTVAGISVGETLKRIEERLNILRPNPELESRWSELRALGEQYRALEAELLEKEHMWAQLTK
jgi:hypothetical protein